MTAKQSTTHRYDEPAIQMLVDDHDEAKKLFKEFDKLSDDERERKEQIIEQVCAALMTHMELEEELFYPSIQDAIRQPDLVTEAVVEHSSAKQLIDNLRSGELSLDVHDATFKVLGEYINHHVNEEEQELFPQVIKTKLDLGLLGEAMRDRKAELAQLNGMPSETTAVQ